MNNNLLIIGAGIYGLVAKEIAEQMGYFDKIDFIDDGRQETPDGIATVGTTANLEVLSAEYGNIVVAIGNPEVRLALLNRMEHEPAYKITTLISPMAYVSPSATIMKGSVIEPMAVIHAGCVISEGCIISAGAVVNHASTCQKGVHVDCNATVAGNTVVPAGLKIKSGTVYQNTSGFHPHPPVPIDGKTYRFDDVM